MIGILLQPHVRATVLGFWSRPQAAENFLRQVSSKEGINTKEFWEFREKYSPGSFSFDAGVEHLGTQVIQVLPAAGMPLHTFTAPHMVSKDFVVPLDPQLSRNEQARDLLSKQAPLPKQENILYSNETDLIYEIEDGKRILFFYRPIEELFQVDGLFDFTDAERALLQDTFWINITELK